MPRNKRRAKNLKKTPPPGQMANYSKDAKKCVGMQNGAADSLTVVVCYGIVNTMLKRQLSFAKKMPAMPYLLKEAGHGHAPSGKASSRIGKSFGCGGTINGILLCLIGGFKRLSRFYHPITFKSQKPLHSRGFFCLILYMKTFAAPTGALGIGVVEDEAGF